MSWPIDGRWRSLRTPLAVPATKQTVEDAVKGLLDAGVGEKFSQGRVQGSQLASYGLDKPSAEIVLTDGGRHVLQIGSTARQSQGGFLRDADDQRVLIVPTFAVDALRNKKPDDFRDKSALPLADADKVRRISLQGTKGTVELEKRGTDWTMTKPLQAKADTMETTSLVSQAKDLQAQSFIPNGAQDLAKYGLDKPRVTLTVTDDAGQHALLIGGQTTEKEPKLYAMRRGEQEVMLLPKTALDSLDKGPNDLYSRDMLTFDDQKVTKLTVMAPKGSYELVKKGSDWWLTKPVSARAEATKVSNLLRSLKTAAAGFVEQNPADLGRFGLQAPPVQATIEVTGEPTLRYFVGGPVPGKDKYWYARTSKSPGVYTIADYVYQDVNQKPDDLKAK